jgi:pimeloyl-ACP methyl ester carboxylesterase
MLMMSLARVQEIAIEPRKLPGMLTVPDGAIGIVVFAHGSGSSRLSPRNQYVAKGLNAARLATLLFDLLLPDEAEDRRNVFDIPLLAGRLEEALDWLDNGPHASLPVGLFGASTGAAAALIAAARRPDHVSAVVSRGGRPDLAGAALTRVKAPTLLVVGGYDDVVIELNEQALATLTCTKQLEIVPGATHLFEEPGTLDAVIALATAWFVRFLGKGSKT